MTEETDNTPPLYRRFRLQKDVFIGIQSLEVPFPFPDPRSDELLELTTTECHFLLGLKGDQTAKELLAQLPKTEGDPGLSPTRAEQLLRQINVDGVLEEIPAPKVARPNRKWKTIRNLNQSFPAILLAIPCLIASFWAFHSEEDLESSWPELLELSEVKVIGGGFLVELKAPHGTEVESGELIARLRDPALEQRLAQLRLEVRETSIEANRYFSEELLEAYRVQREQAVKVEERVLELEDQLRELEIRAEVSGVIQAPDLEDRIGQYQPDGTRLGSLVRIIQSSERLQEG